MCACVRVYVRSLMCVCGVCWGGYDFSQNADCLSEPAGMPPAAVDYRANNWGYKCFSNGKCSLFQTGKAEEGHYDDQLDDGKEADGIARDDDFWIDQPSNTIQARRR